MRARLNSLALLITFCLAACSPNLGGGDASVYRPDGAAPLPTDGGAADVAIDVSQGPLIDATVADAANPYGDADIVGDGGCSGPPCPGTVDDMCGATEICGNGSDDNCDGAIDELPCGCTTGAVQPCFRGQPGRRGVGACVDGTQRCEGGVEFAHWGDCTGGIWPSTDVCDSQDNNCNGCADDNPECCSVELHCPGPGDAILRDSAGVMLSEGAPFAAYTINGSNFYSLPVSTWRWTVVGGPCDQLLESTSGTTSYTLAGATTSTVTFTPTLSGDYTFTVTMTLPDGTVQSCTFVVHIGGPGFRAELCWDRTGVTDIDLHVHRPGTTTPWFTTGMSGMNINPDDCYYTNCKAASWAILPGRDVADWGYTDTPLAACEGGPDGLFWALVGACKNPRLDVDNVATEGIPENINVDNPTDADTFRTMVHYYGGSGGVLPLVNLYCGGRLLGTYGAAPDTVPGFDTSGGFGEGDMWRVADAQVMVDATGTTTGCTLTPLHPPGTTTGYWVTTDDRSY